MSTVDKVLAFVAGLLAELGWEPEEGLHAELSLLKSGVCDSYSILTLAVWIEEEIGREIELSELNFEELWDTPALIAGFIEKNR